MFLHMLERPASGLQGLARLARTIDTVVIGAGQAGLATSYLLTQAGATARRAGTRPRRGTVALGALGRVRPQHAELVAPASGLPLRGRRAGRLRAARRGRRVPRVTTREASKHRCGSASTVTAVRQRSATASAWSSATTRSTPVTSSSPPVRTSAPTRNADLGRAPGMMSSSSTRAPTSAPDGASGRCRCSSSAAASPAARSPTSSSTGRPPRVRLRRQVPLGSASRPGPRARALVARHRHGGRDGRHASVTRRPAHLQPAGVGERRRA